MQSSWYQNIPDNTTSNLLNLATAVSSIGTDVSDSLANIVAEVAVFSEYVVGYNISLSKTPYIAGVYTVFLVLSTILYMFVRSKHRCLYRIYQSA